MIILSIETSCDETAVSIVDAKGGLESPSFSVLGNALFSQIDIHKEYGGVYPMLAKREHARNLIPLLMKALGESSLISNFQFLISKNDAGANFTEKLWEEIKEILVREEGLYESMRTALEHTEKPNIDVISVTSGPGLAPALWVGISCAQALGKLWDIPVVGVNHMEGHIASVLLRNTEEFPISGSALLTILSSSKDNFQFPNESKNAIQFPAVALLVSGGHTELVEIQGWGSYKILGKTLDDAVGEAFDKVARMLGLPYPGGPYISALAETSRTNADTNALNLRMSASGPHVSALHFPRPMIHSNDLNFSFSGLKTSILYHIRDLYDSNYSNIPEEEKAEIAREFEDSVVDVLASKTEKALEQTDAKTLIVAGGVIANKKIRETFLKFEKKWNGLTVRIPTNSLTTDNAIMIACATYLNTIVCPEILTKSEKIIACGNLILK